MLVSTKLLMNANVSEDKFKFTRVFEEEKVENTVMYAMRSSHQHLI